MGHSGNISSKGRTWPNFYYLSKVIMTTTVSTIYPVLVMSLLIILHGLIHLILSIGYHQQIVSQYTDEETTAQRG